MADEEAARMAAAIALAGLGSSIPTSSSMDSNPKSRGRGLSSFEGQRATHGRGTVVRAHIPVPRQPLRGGKDIAQAKPRKEQSSLVSPDISLGKGATRRAVLPKVKAAQLVENKLLQKQVTDYEASVPTPTMVASAISGSAGESESVSPPVKRRRKTKDKNLRNSAAVIDISSVPNGEERHTTTAEPTPPMRVYLPTMAVNEKQVRSDIIVTTTLPQTSSLSMGMPTTKSLPLTLEQMHYLAQSTVTNPALAFLFSSLFARSQPVVSDKKQLALNLSIPMSTPNVSSTHSVPYSPISPPEMAISNLPFSDRTTPHDTQSEPLNLSKDTSGASDFRTKFSGWSISEIIAQQVSISSEKSTVQLSGSNSRLVIHDTKTGTDTVIQNPASLGLQVITDPKTGQILVVPNPRLRDLESQVSRESDVSLSDSEGAYTEAAKDKKEEPQSPLKQMRSQSNLPPKKRKFIEQEETIIAAAPKPITPSSPRSQFQSPASLASDEGYGTLKEHIGLSPDQSPTLRMPQMPPTYITVPASALSNMMVSGVLKPLLQGDISAVKAMESCTVHNESPSKKQPSNAAISMSLNLPTNIERIDSPPPTTKPAPVSKEVVREMYAEKLLDEFQRSLSYARNIQQTKPAFQSQGRGRGTRAGTDGTEAETSRINRVNPAEVSVAMVTRATPSSPAVRPVVLAFADAPWTSVPSTEGNRISVTADMGSRVAQSQSDATPRQFTFAGIRPATTFATPVQSTAPLTITQQTGGRFKATYSTAPISWPPRVSAGHADETVTSRQGGSTLKRAEIAERVVAGADSTQTEEGQEDGEEEEGGQGGGEPDVSTISDEMRTHCKIAGIADDDGDLPIHLAVVHENLEAVEKLLYMMKIANINLNHYNSDKQTPLHLAVITKNKPILLTLLSRGCNPNLPDRKGNTGLHLAVKGNSHASLVAILHESQIQPDLNAKNYEGYTALHLAVIERNQELVQALLLANAKKDLTDNKSGRTALFHAAETKQFNIASMLLQKGADVNIASYAGTTPAQAANGRGHSDLVALLIKYGADVSSTMRDAESSRPAQHSKSASSTVKTAVKDKLKTRRRMRRSSTDSNSCDSSASSVHSTAATTTPVKPSQMRVFSLPGLPAPPRPAHGLETDLSTGNLAFPASTTSLRAPSLPKFVPGRPSIRFRPPQIVLPDSGGVAASLPLSPSALGLATSKLRPMLPPVLAHSLPEDYDVTSGSTSEADSAAPSVDEKSNSYQTNTREDSSGTRVSVSSPLETPDKYSRMFITHTGHRYDKSPFRLPGGSQQKHSLKRTSSESSLSRIATQGTPLKLIAQPVERESIPFSRSSAFNMDYRSQEPDAQLDVVGDRLVLKRLVKPASNGTDTTTAVKRQKIHTSPNEENAKSPSSECISRLRQKLQERAQSPITTSPLSAPPFTRQSASITSGLVMSSPSSTIPSVPSKGVIMRQIYRGDTVSQPMSLPADFNLRPDISPDSLNTSQNHPVAPATAGIPATTSVGHQNATPFKRKVSTAASPSNMSDAGMESDCSIELSGSLCDSSVAIGETGEIALLDSSESMEGNPLTTTAVSTSVLNLASGNLQGSSVSGIRQEETSSHDKVAPAESITHPVGKEGVTSPKQDSSNVASRQAEESHKRLNGEYHSQTLGTSDKADHSTASESVNNPAVNDNHSTNIINKDVSPVPNVSSTKLNENTTVSDKSVTSSCTDGKIDSELYIKQENESQNDDKSQSTPGMLDPMAAVGQAGDVAKPILDQETKISSSDIVTDNKQPVSPGNKVNASASTESNSAGPS